MVILNGDIHFSWNCFIKRPIVYELKNQLTTLGIYNYHGFYLFIAILTYKNNNYLFCYNFTYSQCYHLILIFMNVSSSCHLLIVPFMNIWSVRRFLILLYAMWYISYSIYKWYKSVMILNILKKYLSCDLIHIGKCIYLMIY